MYRVFSFVFVLAFALSSNLYAHRNALHTGAGVLPFFLENPTEPDPKKRRIKIALGEEPRRNGKVVGDFGGKRDQGESFPQAGYREFQEETGHYSFPHVSLNQVQTAPYLPHYHQPSDQYYELYLVQVIGKMPTVQEMIANGRTATARLGHNAHVEKTNYFYVDVDQFLHSILNNQNCPGTNLPYFRSFKAAVTRNLPTFQQFVDSIRNQPPLKTPVPVPVPAPTPVQTAAATPVAAISAPATIAPAQVSRRVARKAKPATSRRRTTSTRRSASRKRTATRSTRTSRKRSTSRPKRVRKQRHASRSRRVRQQGHPSRRTRSR